MRKEIIANIRAEYDQRKDERNIDKLRFFLAAGQKDFKNLQGTLDLSFGMNKQELKLIPGDRPKPRKKG
jgi:hypothetical protein